MNDKPKPKLSRRTFLIGSATVIGSAALAQLYRLLAKAGYLASNTYLPIISKQNDQTAPTSTQNPNATATRTPTRTSTPNPNHSPTPTRTPTRTATKPAITPMPGSGRVVHVRHASATSWKGDVPFYTAVTQTAVNAMTLDGLKALTGQSDWAAIWHSLFSRIHAGGYSQGQKIVIKVNLNNSMDNDDCGSHNSIIDALPQPISALIAGMKEAQVLESDIIICDPSGRAGGWNGKFIPQYLRDYIHAAFPGVTYVGRAGCSDAISASYGKDPSLTVTFPIADLGTRLLADVFYDATYVINMPILKRHGGDAAIPVSLGFKNHLGSINDVIGSGEGKDDSIHTYIDPKYEDPAHPENPNAYKQTYSPLVTLYSHPCIGGKTILTVGDGLFGAHDAATSAANSWPIIFQGQPANSLFFATDPVAIDCVMADIIRAAGWISTKRTYDYLFCAETAGLGICEGTRDNPGGNPLISNGYSKINYIRHDLS